MRVLEAGSSAGRTAWHSGSTAETPAVRFLCGSIPECSIEPQARVHVWMLPGSVLSGNSKCCTDNRERATVCKPGKIRLQHAPYLGRQHSPVSSALDDTTHLRCNQSTTNGLRRRTTTGTPSMMSPVSTAACQRFWGRPCPSLNLDVEQVTGSR